MAEYNQNYENNHGPIYNADTIININNFLKIPNFQAISNLSSFNTNFIELPDFNQKMNIWFESKCNKIIISGSSGVGKSATITHWARSNSNNFSVICYIFARNGNLVERFVDFFVSRISLFCTNSQELSVELAQIINPKDKLKVILPYFPQGKKIIILDDILPKQKDELLDFFDELKEYSDFCFVMTAKSKNIFNLLKNMELKPSQELCLAILAEIYGDNPKEKLAAENICDYVGNNTLAIMQISALAKTPDNKGKKLSLENLFEELKSQKGLKNTKLNQEDRELFHTDGIYKTLEMVWQRLSSDQFEVNLALLCGNMELALLPDYWFDELKNIPSWKEIEIGRWNLVKSYILEEISEKTWKLPELWYLFLQDQIEELKEESKKANLENFAYSIIIHCTTFSQLYSLDKNTLEKYNLLIPHVKKLCNFIESLGKDEILQYINVNDISDPYSLISKFYSTNNLELAVEYAEKELKIIYDFFSNQSKEYAESFLQVINLKHLQSKNFTEVKRCEILLDLFKEIEQKKINELIKISEEFKQCEFCIILGRIYCDIASMIKNINKGYQIEPEIQEVINKSYINSEKLYNNAIYCLNHSKRKDDSEIKKSQIFNQYSNIYGELGNLYADFDQFEKSLINYQNSIQILEQDENNIENSVNYAITVYNLATLYFFIKPDNIEGQKWLQSQTNWYLIASEYAQKSLTLAEIVFEKEDDRYKLSKNLVQKLKITREYNKLKECNIIFVGGEHTQDLADYWNKNIEDIINQNLDKI